MASVSSDEMGLSSHVELNRYFLVATIAILSYDFVLTLADEIQLVWPSRMSFSKLLFFLNRYLPFIASIGQAYAIIRADSTSMIACKYVFQTFSGIAMANYVVAELVLYLRAYAVWGGEKRSTVILALAYLGYFSSNVYLALRSILHATVPPISRTLFPSGCMLIINGEMMWSLYLILIMSEFFALIMLVIKANRTSHSARLEQILDDGVAYFILLLVTSTCTAFVLRLAPDDFSNLIFLMQAIIHSIVCSHLLLRIRKGGRQHLPSITSGSECFHLVTLRAFPSLNVYPNEDEE